MIDRFFIWRWVSQPYFEGVYIRKKKNGSGVISIQIYGKPRGKYKFIEKVGSSSDPIQIEQCPHEPGR